MDAATKEWLEHLEKLILDAIFVIQQEHKHSLTERLLGAAVTQYNDRMENL